MRDKRIQTSVVGLLVDEVVERLQGVLQLLLVDFESVLRHVVLADLDEAVHARAAWAQRPRAFPSGLQRLLKGWHLGIHLLAVMEDSQSVEDVQEYTVISMLADGG